MPDAPEFAIPNNMHGFQLKRRKNGGFGSSAVKPADNRKKCRTADRSCNINAGMDTVSWPAEEIPVELFTIIISFLPRSNIQSMRLVNHEFERKVSEYMFRVVVVPFKPELYGINAPSEAQRTEALERGSIMLQDKGMRVFESFGRHIFRFAMSFEFEEGKLAQPPIKSNQEAIRTFWGVYRWPFKNYNRYAQLEGLEQTADETRTMAKALRFVVNARELGLSIDGGLGWLAGPDLNSMVIKRDKKVMVFGETRYPPESKPKPKVPQKPILGHGQSMPIRISNRSRASSPRTPPNRRQQSIHNIPEDASRASHLLGEHANRRLDFGESSLLTMQGHEAGNSPGSNVHVENLGGGRTLTVDYGPSLPRRVVRRLPRVQANGRLIDTSDNDDDNDSDDVEAGDHEGAEAQAVAQIEVTSTGARAMLKSEEGRLKPNNLTNAQREMLLETEWAQRAFMQSYAIAIIDNSLTFNNIQTFTIARLPHRHLSILRREDFWDSLPCLQNLSIAIIPDWRDVLKLSTSWVQDINVLPSRSVTGVHQLLLEQVAHRSNITKLHLEWLCGGEEAPGLFARNQHILAAPVVSTAIEMLDRTRLATILSLPYVKHLSLKNCWISPHILRQVISELTRQSLQTFAFDSVSLTAPLPLNACPRPAPNDRIGGAAAYPPVAINQPQGQQHLNPPVPLVNGNPPPQLPGAPAFTLTVLPTPAPVHALDSGSSYQDWLQQPRLDSWAHLIDTVTPGRTLADMRYAREKGPEPSIRAPTTLRELIFKSCGYVNLPMDFDQRVINGPEAHYDPEELLGNRIAELEGSMMKSGDTLLATIVNHINVREERCLGTAWNMKIGWNQIRPRSEFDEAVLDGIVRPGRGRFSGVIEAAAFTACPPRDEKANAPLDD